MLYRGDGVMDPERLQALLEEVRNARVSIPEALPDPSLVWAQKWMPMIAMCARGEVANAAVWNP